MATANEAIQRAAAQSNAGVENSEGCYICQKTLWISIFFDEPAHDARDEYGTDKLSNIGKLFHSHAESPKLGIYRLYYNGLGVKFKEPNIARREAGTDVGQEAGGDVLKDKAKDVAKSAATKGVKKGFEELKDLRNPKKWGWDIAGIFAKIGIESSDTIRDKPLVSDITLSGVSTRVDNAVAKIKEIVGDQTLPVNHINVAVFGSGLGGAMARLFVNKLLEACKLDTKIIYPTAKGDTTLEIQFLGLLDCISATISDNWMVSLFSDKISFGFATTRVKGPMGVPEQVMRTSHYIAGHELRVTRRLDSVRKGRGQLMTEITLPGNHDDIVGNYEDGFLNRSNQLSRIAGKKLHSDAYKAGVPMLSMPKLEKTDFKLYNLIQPNAELQVHVGQPKMPLEHLLVKYPNVTGTLEKQFLEHTRRLVSWMSLRYDTPGARGRPGDRAYKMVEDRLDYLRKLKVHPHGQKYLNALRAEELALIDTWFHPKMDDYMQAVFDEFIHDECYLSRWDIAASDVGGYGSYFSLRAIDESDEFSTIEKSDAVKAEEAQQAKWKAESEEYRIMTQGWNAR